MSQILNSRLWELKKNGESIEDIYNDICKLAVLSCIAIDMAKKEFTINISDELKLLRNKYQDLIKNKPMFFYHLPKDEQMKSEKSKYRNYDTTMDYLESILNEVGRRTRTKHGEKKEFSMLFEKNPSGVCRNIKQINKVIEMRDIYKNTMTSIWKDENSTKQEKYLQSISVRESYISDIQKIKMNEATIKRLLLKIEKGNQIHLASILFETHRDKFLELIKHQMEDIDIIERSENGSFELYGKKFVKMALKVQI